MSRSWFYIKVMVLSQGHGYLSRDLFLVLNFVLKHSLATSKELNGHLYMLFRVHLLKEGKFAIET